VAGLLASSAAWADVYRVDGTAPPGGDGLSWDTAFKYLQDALGAAAAGGEIRIAGGIYQPDQDEAGNVTPGDRHASVHLVSALAIYGGYAGLANPGNPDARDIALYQTILSGDLAGNDDPNDVFLNRSDNSYHVVIASSTDAGARLDGVTIQGGFAVVYDGEPNGGGIYMVDGSATFVDCTIRRNATYLGTSTPNAPAAGSGAGVYCEGGAPTFTHCTLSGNAAGPGQNAYGMYSLNSSAGGSGGGLSFKSAQPHLSGCLFADNRAGVGGEGNVFPGASSWNGAAGGSGGAVCLTEFSEALFEDCAMINNHAGVGGKGGDGGMAIGQGTAGGNGGSGGAVFATDSSVSCTGCTFSGNESGGGGKAGFAGTPYSGRTGGDGGGGGAVYCESGGADFAGCEFSANHTGAGGAGGMASQGTGGTGGRGGDGAAVRLNAAAVALRNCRVTANVTGNGGNGGGSQDFCGYGGHAGDGAGLVATGFQSTLALTNSLIAGNHTGNGGNSPNPYPSAGGGAGCSAGVRSEAQLTLRNCTVAGNAVGNPGTPNGATAATGGLELLAGGTADLCNLILWDNTGAAATVEGRQVGGTPTTIDHCCVQGWTGDLGGVGNIGGDPLFVDPVNGNYHLGAGSAAVDAGNNACVEPEDLDLDSNQRRADDPTTPDCPQGGCGDPPIVDMGCYEFGAPPGDCNDNGIPDDFDPAICRGDCNCDGVVDFADINPFVSALVNGVHCDGTGCNADINGDCTVDFGDINPFVALLTSAPLPISCD
jgi:hypothetical protein